MPKLSKSSVKAVPIGEHIERASAGLSEWKGIQEVPKARLVARFREYGLDDHEIQMIFDRFYDNLTFVEMARKRGWVNTGAAAYALRKLLHKLRDGGFQW